MTIRHLITALTLSTIMCACSSNKHEELRQVLSDYISDKSANIGIGIIIDGNDTIDINGKKRFPMLSVYKFPIALALADYYRTNSMTFDHPVAILKDDLRLDTHSPMTEKILAADSLVAGSLMMPTRTLLAYMLQESDNNATDILLKELRGADYVAHWLNAKGFHDIHVVSTEKAMHDDPALCYANSTTPLAMASLLDKFNNGATDPLSLEIKKSMENCPIKTKRLPRAIHKTKAVIGHKTGTGIPLSNGHLMAVNDAGYVNLPDGRRYAIAVFIEDSAYDLPTTEAIIAEISRITFSALTSGKAY